MKNYCHIWNQHPRIYQNAKLYAKIKILKFGPKWLFLIIFRLKFEKANVIFEISTLKFIQIPKIEQNNKNDNSNNKKCNQKCLIWVFWPINLKNYDYIWNQHPRSCRNRKNCSKQKEANLVPKMPYLGILSCKFEKLLIYLKSAPSNLSKCKVLCKNKNP